MRFNFNKVIGRYLFSVHLQKMPPLYTIGITNETADYKFLPFLDLDNMYLSKVEKCVAALQEEFDLSPAIVLCSSARSVDEKGREFGNYMVIFFDKMLYHDVIDVLRMAPVDDISVRMPRFYKSKNWVLRMSEKRDKEGNVIVGCPVYIKTIYPERSNYLEHIHSSSHYQYLQSLFGFKDFKLNLDEEDEIAVTVYNTHGKVVKRGEVRKW